MCPGKYILPLLVGNPDRVAVNFRTTTNLVMSLLGLSFSIITILGGVCQTPLLVFFLSPGAYFILVSENQFFQVEKE